ncbi:hypothetical protein [Streptomyces sp. AF1A]|uniref:hypothetical protein n=1 Tax=Streptomyces sp. AF1A TaxID=3394350 RepID=UPI0039BCB139
MLVRAWVDDDQLVVRLPWTLAMAARRRTLRLPLDCVADVRVEPSWWRAVRIGMPGRHYRFRAGRWCAGELVHAKGRDFVALWQGAPALVVDCHPWKSPYARLALSVRDPHALAALLRQRTDRGSDREGAGRKAA